MVAPWQPLERAPMSSPPTPSEVNPSGVNRSLFDYAKEIFKIVEETANKGAATGLFTVGTALLVFVYAVRFFKLPLIETMTSEEFYFSVEIGALLTLCSALIRLFIFYSGMARSKEVEKDLIEFQKKVQDQKATRTQMHDDQQNKNTTILS